MREYSEDFKNRCKLIYPTWERLHQMLDLNASFVGRYLCDSCVDGINNKTVLESENIESLKEIAILNQNKNELYNEWLKCYS